MTFGRYGTILAQASFRRFWIGFTVSALGDAMTRVALTWFVYEQTHSPAAIGWLMLCYTGPVVVGGLLAGTLLDRFDRRTVMLVDQVCRGLTVLLVPVLYAFGQLAVWHVYLVAAVYGLLMMIVLAGSPALVPDLVHPDQLATANALEMLSYTLAGIAGPPLAGLLIAVVGAPNVVVLDAISYFGFALALIRVRTAVPAKSTQRDGGGYHMTDAIRLLTRNPVLLVTTLMFMSANIGIGFSGVWLPILSAQELGGGPGLYGTLLGVLAVGEVVGTLLIGGISLRASLGSLICGAQLCSGLALTTLLLGRHTVLVASALVLFGVFSAPLTIWAQTLRMQVIPERLRGRTFALLRMLIQSTGPIGGAAAGMLLPILGLSAMIGLSALLVGLPGLAGYGVRPLRLAGTAPGKEAQAMHLPRPVAEVD